MKHLLIWILCWMTSEIQAQISYLALGDSYTIGESVAATLNYPNQTVAMVRSTGVEIADAEIIARTGWTTFELSDRLDAQPPYRDSYDFVSLLIGVNNQYRGLSIEAYTRDFESLLLRAIEYAGGLKDRVIVLSIPDWGVTPFAANRDGVKIALEIDAFNQVNESLAAVHGVKYLMITDWTREALIDRSLLANDGLHPGEKEYQRWAEVISSWML